MRYDAVIIGGGPAGSAAAIYLAEKGRRVLLLEKAHFPRFHVGESLLPYSRPFFEELGVMPALESGGFVRKFGAQFHLGSGEKSIYFSFGDGVFTEEHETLQVERAHFDSILLDRAREVGAEVREGWRVQRFCAKGEHVELGVIDPNGGEHREEGCFLIDASGRHNLTGNQEGLRKVHPDMRKVAIFGHFEGVNLDRGKRGGDTVIVRMKHHWFWIIPLSQQRTSVGCVLDKDAIRAEKDSPKAIFYREVEKAPAMRARMSQATPVGQLRSTGDFSYHNARAHGHRVLRVGDAIGFMDPIFSAGVHMALYSAKLASEAIEEAIVKETDGRRLFRAYGRRVLSAMAVYWKMVEHFYTQPFMEILLEPRERWQLVSAVNVVLAGKIDLPWRVKWRLHLFFLLVRLQKHWPLVPRISW